MALHRIRQGLDLPITGAPEQSLEAGREVTRVAAVGLDFPLLKPGMAVKAGDAVKRGQTLFEDRKTPGVRHTAPGAGRVVAVHRGRFRVLQSVVIELTDSERRGEPAPADLQPFSSYTRKAPENVSRDEVVALLVESGMWTALRTRPFGRVPEPEGDAPHSVFVTASDTHPHSPEVDAVLEGKQSDFEAGLFVVQTLTEGKTYLCKTAGSNVTAGSASGVAVEEFAGPHPAGTVGIHIHTLDPVHAGKKVWHVDYQDVVSIGRLFRTGALDVERVVSLAGPTVKRPRLLSTRLGASLDELTQGELQNVENRVVSGSVLTGRASMGEVHGFLGRYHSQISSLREDRERELLGWLNLGVDRFSTSGIYLSQLAPGKKFAMTTTTNGSHRDMVPIGMYERVFPFDILPTFLLRALLVGDIERAQALGVLELDEEDVALCSFVCPGKHDYGQVLRKNLDEIWSDS